MEWLVLVLVMPAILIPVVLLWGFAGCDFNPTALPAGVQAPTNLRATGRSVSTIRLTWDNPNLDPVSFQVERTKEGESIPELLSASTTTLDDAGLLEATTYFYQVRAIRQSDNEPSDLSEQAVGRTIGVVFQAQLTENQTDLEGFCLVQRIEPARLRMSTLPGGFSTPGARVRITLRGSTQTNLILTRIFISQSATSGDPYDSAADLTHVASNVVVDANTPVALSDIDYDLDHTKPLLIAFDISSNPGSGSVRLALNVPATDATMYFRQLTAEAGTADRSPSAANPGAPPFIPSNTIYLVEKIEVV